jgi:hypothetical protein
MPVLKRWWYALELKIDFGEFMNFSGEIRVGGTIKNEAVNLVLYSIIFL